MRCIFNKVTYFQKLDPRKAFVKACEWDYCLRKEEGACQTIANFAAECRNQQIDEPKTWRRDNFCRECETVYQIGMEGVNS
jgi:C8 domain